MNRTNLGRQNVTQNFKIYDKTSAIIERCTPLLLLNQYGTALDEYDSIKIKHYDLYNK